MANKPFTLTTVMAVAFWLICGNQLTSADVLAKREWQVDGVTREALVHIPDSATKNPTPVVFGFHGHGGSMQNAARSFRIHTLWPDAIVVYMQGLNTPGRLTDPEGKKPGWQKDQGDQGDRDLKFFDAVLTTLKKEFQVDTRRVFATGHSNGAAFSYLLLVARGEHFAAVAPSAGFYLPLVGLSRDAFGRIAARGPRFNGPAASKEASNRGAHEVPRTAAAKPILHIAGKDDTLVKFEWQKRFLEALRQQRQCSEGITWNGDKRCTAYESKSGGDIITYIHQGTHAYPKEAPELIVKFFQAVGR